MKRYLILLLLICFCGGSSETTSVEDTTTTSSSSTSTSTSTTTTTSVPKTTTTTVPETTTTTIASGLTVEIVCEPETSEDGYLGFKLNIYNGSSELEVLNIVSWFDSSRADDLFIYEDLPAPNETKELMYSVDPTFTKYEIEIVVMDSNGDFVSDYCLWSK
jgi:hypothetical protein